MLSHPLFSLVSHTVAVFCAVSPVFESENGFHCVIQEAAVHPMKETKETHELERLDFFFHFQVK